tara:strand:+ start:112 stop:342 length:231 start_codon:yes stop_codon:yes gene_type:complete
MLFSIYAITVGTNWDSRLISETLNQEQQTEAGKIFFADSIPNLANLLLTDFVLAFELVSVLLLAAAVGALALVRNR